MEFSINLSVPEKTAADCLVLPVFGTQLSALAAELDQDGWLAETCTELGESIGSTLFIPLPGRRVLFVQLGDEKKLNAEALRKAGLAAAKALLAGKSKSADIFLAIASAKAIGLKDAVAIIAQSLVYESYLFVQFKSEPEAAPVLTAVNIAVSKKSEVEKAEQGLQAGVALGHGMNLTRDLGNLPGNVCTPTYLANAAHLLAASYKLKCTVLEKADMEALGMGSLLSVAQGSIEPPKLICLEYQGGKKSDKPVVLVGKGITFDSGGISLKPGAEMDEMKFDMCGAATVMGVIRAIAEQGLAINVVGVIPTCENMPSSNAVKPGDIVTSMSGQTIEILNTDAEGRLILCDALTYVARYEPELVIDIATLTGAIIIGLGHVASGLFSNDDELADDLLKASRDAGDKTWRMPLWDDYQEQLKSNFADMANIGGRPAGSITAAAFLSRFTKEYHWAHLDIAGIAHKSGAAKGATGRPVPLLVEFLAQRAAAKKK